MSSSNPPGTPPFGSPPAGSGSSAVGSSPVATGSAPVGSGSGTTPSGSRRPFNPSEGIKKFPDIAQYQAAVRGKHFLDPISLECSPKLSKFRKPLHYSGAFAVAFPLLDGEGKSRYAVRFWTQRVPGNTRDRYRSLQLFLEEHADLAEHFATFQYFDEGVT